LNLVLDFVESEYFIVQRVVDDVEEVFVTVKAEIGNRVVDNLNFIFDFVKTEGWAEDGVVNDLNFILNLVETEDLIVECVIDDLDFILNLVETEDLIIKNVVDTGYNIEVKFNIADFIFDFIAPKVEPTEVL
jgi:6-pyruvoyl-tetrahydropterin synthase